MRNKLLIVSLLLIFVVVLSACGGVSAPALPGGQQPSSRNVSVTGAGQVTLKPDIAYIYIGVHTETPSAADAVAQNNADSQKLINALKAAGVAEADLRTTNFSIWTNTPYTTDGQPAAPVYAVDNTVYVTVRDLAGLGNLLDVAVKAGANNINNIQFDVADKTQALSEARKLAVASAKQQASELATAAGVTLGEIESISYYDAAPYPVYDGAGGRGGAADMSAPINPGAMQLTVNVTISYAIK